MYGLEISAIINLQGKTAKNARDLQELLTTRSKETTYGFDYVGARIAPLMGGYVRVDFTRHGSPSNNWTLFDGLCVRMVEVKEAGSDLFPTAGFYCGNTVPELGIRGVTAVVRWQLDHKYPLAEEVLQAVVDNARRTSEYTDSFRLDVPVAFSRSWTLVLTASSLKRAMTAYELLRGGKWQPKTKFVDELPDPRKLRLLQPQISE